MFTLCNKHVRIQSAKWAEIERILPNVLESLQGGAPSMKMTSIQNRPTYTEHIFCNETDSSTEYTVLAGLLCTQQTTFTEISIFSQHFLSRSLFFLVTIVYTVHIPPRTGTFFTTILTDHRKKSTMSSS